MGILYYVACRDCGVCRDIDKLRPEVVSSKLEAIDAAVQLNNYRAALLVGFLAEHQGHNCTMFNDAEDQHFFDEFVADNADFWD